MSDCFPPVWLSGHFRCYFQAVSHSDVPEHLHTSVCLCACLSVHHYMHPVCLTASSDSPVKITRPLSAHHLSSCPSNVCTTSHYKQIGWHKVPPTLHLCRLLCANMESFDFTHTNITGKILNSRGWFFFRGDLHLGDSWGLSRGWGSVLLHCLQPAWLHPQHGQSHCHCRWVKHYCWS